MAVRFRVGRDEFADAVGWVARGLPARPATPVLAGVLLDASADRLTLSNVDHDVSSRIELAAAGATPGLALVSGHLLAPIARTLPDHPVEVSVDGNRAVLRCGPARFGLPLLPAETRPRPPGRPPDAGRVSGARFAAAVAGVAVAAGQDDTLPVLTGMSLRVSGRTLTLSATDRYRLATAELPWEPAVAGPDRSALIPARMLADAVRPLAGAAAVTVCLPDPADPRHEGLVGLHAGSRHTTARLIDATFPSVGRLWPGSFPTTADVPARALVEAIGRVCLVAGPHAPVRLCCRDGLVRVSAGGPGTDPVPGSAARADPAAEAGTADAEQEVPAAVDGPPVAVAFTPRYLLDGLRAAGGDTVRLSLTARGRPVMVTAHPGGPGGTDGPDGSGESAGPAPGFRYLAMSLRNT